jgi:uncharacterized iron-regulated membrane protein
MRISTGLRKTHYWLAIAAALPVLVILTTGLLLQVKKQSAWVQPPEQRGAEGVPAVSLDQILSAAREAAPAHVRGWDDISRVDVRPKRNLIKVSTNDNWEIQIDGATGKPLQVAYRRSDLIESLHDGSWFHENAKLFIFLPAGLMLLVLWLTGMYMFVLPILLRRRARRLLAARSAAHPKE